jgi:hypothetical protein
LNHEGHEGEQRAFSYSWSACKRCCSQQGRLAGSCAAIPRRHREEHRFAFADILCGDGDAARRGAHQIRPRCVVLLHGAILQRRLRAASA